ncbi:cupin domain-containing protein [Amycolatopsis alba]|uniref:Uncharacterized protein n=1 Tax=Amycolatopsis alba DSM 44262 TaxID=1125972 RepID=A0A229R9V8_AMYAL|nr:cupin domain-containing protein [Amycolatopsis alba]OXM43453.1 hypothetical protein CFP75_38420 [Amycolatopsis alba DSM 44262]
MSSTSTAVHRPPTGADTHIHDDGSADTAVIYTPAVPVRAVSAGRMHIPGGKTTTPQRHRTTEAILTIISGYSAILSGHHLETALPRPGDMIYIPPATPYCVVNLSLNASVLILSFRGDPGFSADIEHLPDLGPQVLRQVDKLRSDHMHRLMSRRTGHVRRTR